MSTRPHRHDDDTPVRPWRPRSVEGAAGSSCPRAPIRAEAGSPSQGCPEGPGVAGEVLTWREEWDLHRRRMAMAKAFATYRERLHRARTRREILDTVTAMAHQVLEASGTLLFLSNPDGGGGLVAHRPEGPPGRFEGSPAEGRPGAERGPGPEERPGPAGIPEPDESMPILSPEALEGFGAPVILTRETLESDGEPELSPLGELLAPAGKRGAASLAVVPVGRHGLLVVAERRRGREWDDEDLFFLRSLARAADEGLSRSP